MYHAIRILLCVLLTTQLLGCGSAVDKNPGKDLLSNLADNVGSFFAPSLIKGLESRPIRTSLIESIGSASVPATTTEKPSSPRPSKGKVPRLTSSTTRKPRTTSEAPPSDKLKFRPEQRPQYPGADSANAAQNQFPFDLRNQFNFPGAGAGGGGQFNPGLFGGDQGAFNPAGLRPFDADQGSGSRNQNDNGIQGNDGRNPTGDSGFNNGGQRPFVNNGNFDGFRNGFGRFGFDDSRFQGRFQGGDGFNSGFRPQDNRFAFDNYPGQQGGQGAQDGSSNNFRQDFRFQNSLNDQRAFPQFPGGFNGQGFAPSNFDAQPNQRFQNPFGDNFRQGGQQGGFPLFFPGGLAPGAQGVSRPAQTPAGGNSSNGNAPNPLTSASKNNEQLQNPAVPEGKSSEYVLTESPSTNFREQRLFYPQLDDYSDLRFRPDGFLINSKFSAKRGINRKV